METELLVPTSAFGTREGRTSDASIWQFVHLQPPLTLKPGLPPIKTFACLAEWNVGFLVTEANHPIPRPT